MVDKDEASVNTRDVEEKEEFNYLLDFNPSEKTINLSDVIIDYEIILPDRFKIPKDDVLSFLRGYFRRSLVSFQGILSILPCSSLDFFRT